MIDRYHDISKNRNKSLLAYNYHLKLKQIYGRAERCGTEAVKVKCNAANAVFYGICGQEAIRVWLRSLPNP